MNTHEITYLFEHQLLPSWFFQQKEQFIGMILQHKDFLFRVIDDIFVRENIDNPYREDEFDVGMLEITDEVFMVEIKFPKPNDTTLCYNAYMFFDKEFEKTNYFCIEYSANIKEGSAFICGWTAEGDHLNYGTCELEENACILKCADIFMETHYGMTRVKK